MSVRSLTISHPVAYQAHTLSKRIGEGIEDIDSWIEPLCPSIFGTSGLIYPLDLLVKNGENIGWRVAVLELGGERMGKQIPLRPFFVRFQRIIDDKLKIV